MNAILSSPTPNLQNDVSISFFSDFEVAGSPEFLKNFSSDLWIKISSISFLSSFPSSTEKNRAKRLRKKSKK
jgi:hypothetical protein